MIRIYLQKNSCYVGTNLQTSFTISIELRKNAMIFIEWLKKAEEEE